jgi:hypothetical protein
VVLLAERAFTAPKAQLAEEDAGPMPEATAARLPKSILPSATATSVAVHTSPPAASARLPSSCPMLPGPTLHVSLLPLGVVALRVHVTWLPPPRPAPESAVMDKYQ